MSLKENSDIYSIEEEFPDEGIEGDQGLNLPYVNKINQNYKVLRRAKEEEIKAIPEMLTIQSLIDLKRDRRPGLDCSIAIRHGPMNLLVENDEEGKSISSIASIMSRGPGTPVRVSQLLA